MVLTRVCSKCSVPCDVGDFPRNRSRSAGASSWCVDCTSTYNAIYRKQKPEKFRKYWADYVARHPGRATQKNYFNKLSRVYGLSEATYTEMLQAQNRLCATCGKDLPLCVDHDHVTGKVRGLLCDPCNTTLGKIHESVETLQAMIGYLNEHKQNSDSASDRSGDRKTEKEQNINPVSGLRPVPQGTLPEAHGV